MYLRALPPFVFLIFFSFVSHGEQVPAFHGGCVNHLKSAYVAGPNLRYSWSIMQEDRCANGGQWEDNGNAEAGEQIQFYLEIRNDGDAPATCIQAQLASLDPAIAVLHGESSFQDILPGQARYSDFPFGLAIQEDFSCPLYLDLELTLNTEEGIFSLPLYFFAWGMHDYYSKKFHIWPPYRWAVVDNGGCGNWIKVPCPSSPYAGQRYCAEASTVGCTKSTNAILRMPPLDMAHINGSWLCFHNSSVENPGPGTHAYIEVTLDEGLTWDVIKDLTEFPLDQCLYILPLKSMNPRFQFRLVSDSAGPVWRIDNVKFTDLQYPAFSKMNDSQYYVTCGTCGASAGCDAPNSVYLALPPDGAMEQALDLRLEWQASQNAIYYEVLLGESDGAWSRVGSSADSWQDLHDLKPATKYYWKVVAFNECGFKHTASWEFTTRESESNGHHHIPPVSPP